MLLIKRLKENASGYKQQGLCLDEKTAAQALQLFRESKPLLLANIGTIGTGTVSPLNLYFALVIVQDMVTSFGMVLIFVCFWTVTRHWFSSMRRHF